MLHQVARKLAEATWHMCQTGVAFAPGRSHQASGCSTALYMNWTTQCSHQTKSSLDEAIERRALTSLHHTNAEASKNGLDTKPSFIDSLLEKLRDFD
jgi:hypothetical protein